MVGRGARQTNEPRRAAQIMERMPRLGQKRIRRDVVAAGGEQE